MVNIKEWIKSSSKEPPNNNSNRKLNMNNDINQIMMPQISQQTIRPQQQQQYFTQQQQQQPLRPSQQFQQQSQMLPQQLSQQKAQYPQQPQQVYQAKPNNFQSPIPQQQQQQPQLQPKPQSLQQFQQPKQQSPPLFKKIFGRSRKKSQQPQPQQQSTAKAHQQQQPVVTSNSQQNLNKLKIVDAKNNGIVQLSDKNCIRCQITYLDETIKTFDVDKAAMGQHLFNIVCEDLELIEKDYFSLTFRDSNNMKFWLDHEKKIKSQLKGVVAVAQPIFNFEVKFYPPEPNLLQEEITRYLLTLQLRHDIMDGKLPCSFVTHALLGSYSVQAELGDHDPEIHGTGYGYLEGFFFAPHQTIQLLEAVAEYHKDHKGQSPAEAEMHFLENSVKLAMYGVDLHNGKDSDGVDILLGVSASGLMVYRDHLRINRFAWPKILKISYKRNYFYLKLRAGEFEKYESTIGFRCPNHKAAKRLWKIAVEHHAFFRLREPEKPKKQLLPSFNPRFRYTGQSTYIQSRYRSVERQQPAFERSLSKRLTQSMDRGLASSTAFQRPNMSSKSIPDKINMSDEEDEYVTDELQNVKYDNRMPGPIMSTDMSSVKDDYSNKRPVVQQIGPGRFADDGTYSKPNVATSSPIVNSMISSSTPIPTQDRRYVQPALSQQRTASDGRSSGPITPTIQRIQERQYMPQYEQPKQQQVLTEQQLPYVKQPSMPTTPQDRRYVQQKYEQSEEEEEADVEANSSVFFTDNNMAAQVVERGYPNQFDTQMQFQSDNTKPNERRVQSQFEELTVYKQSSVPTTPQGRRFKQQHDDDDKGQQKPPSVPTTPQAYRNNQVIDEQVAIKPPAVPSVVAQTQDRNRNPIQVDNKAQDRRYVQQQSPGQYRPSLNVQPSERRNIEDKSSDDESQSSINDSTKHLKQLIAGLKQDKASSEQVPGRSVSDRSGPEPNRPPRTEYNVAAPQRPPPPPPQQLHQADQYITNVLAKPRQSRDQQESDLLTAMKKGSQQSNSQIAIEQSTTDKQVVNSEANHQDVLLRAIQLATALDPSLEVEQVEINTD